MPDLLETRSFNGDQIQWSTPASRSPTKQRSCLVDSGSFAGFYCLNMMQRSKRRWADRIVWWVESCQKVCCANVQKCWPHVLRLSDLCRLSARKYFFSIKFALIIAVLFREWDVFFQFEVITAIVMEHAGQQVLELCNKLALFIWYQFSDVIRCN